METDLYKIRSISSCISAGYTLFSNNFKTIFKRTWLAALVLSILYSASILLYLPDKGISDFGLTHPNVVLIAMFAINILFIVAAVWLLTCLINLFNDAGFKKNLIRYLVLAIFFIALDVILYYVSFMYGYGAGTIITKLTDIDSAIAIFIIASFLIVIAIAVPLYFSITKYLIDHKTPLKNVIAKDFVRGFRHWGFIFSTLLIIGIISLLIAFVVFIPMLILLSSQIMNQLGMINGDPSGVPSYFIYLLYGIITLIIFILTYLSMWSFTVMCHVYGSIETSENERKQETKIKLN